MFETLKLGTIAFILLSSCVAMAWTQAEKQTISLAGLDSPDWTRRCEAYEAIKSNEQALKRPQVRKALMDLLDRESRLIVKTFEDSHGEVGVDGKYGEEYSEYYGQLKLTVDAIADWHDPRQLCILAQTAYNPDSRFADELAVKGGAAVVPCLLKMAQGSISLREQSVPVLVHLLFAAGDLAPAVRRQIKQLIIAELQDREGRWETIKALGRFGTLEWIPILEPIAHNDPYSRLLDNGTRRFDVRELAAKAIQSIQRRAEAHTSQ
jgi:hypothetical protein